MNERLTQAEEALRALLGPELEEITDIVSDTTPNSDNPYLIEIPGSQSIDLPLEELASAVARTSNAYGRIARFAGMANAEYKLAKGRYERKYKKHRIGNNDAERDRRAMEACEEEHLEMTIADAVSELAGSLEQAARVGSESARKILDKVESMSYAQRREERGSYRDEDFTPY